MKKNLVHAHTNTRIHSNHSSICCTCLHTQTVTELKTTNTETTHSNTQNPTLQKDKT